MDKLRGSKSDKAASVDMHMFSLGNPMQGLSDVIFGGCNCGCDCGGGGGPIFIFCCLGSGSGHLIDESEIVL
ncbi:MAG: hypothetical protein ACTTI3_08185 [Treponema sp.]